MNRHSAAFTLIEAIIAMVLLSIAVPPMLWAIHDAHRQRVNPVLASRARWLATEQLEDILADRHSTTRGYEYLTGSNYPEQSPVPGHPGFDRRVVFTETEADLTTPGEGYMNVTVEITWTDSMQQPRTLSVSTVLTEYDAN